MVDIFKPIPEYIAVAVRVYIVQLKRQANRMPLARVPIEEEIRRCEAWLVNPVEGRK